MRSPTAFAKAYRQLHVGGPWFGESIAAGTAGISEAEAAQACGPHAKTVHHVARHLLQWRRTVDGSFTGSDYPIAVDGPRDWPAPDQAWAETRTALLYTGERFAVCVEACDPTHWSSRVPGRDDGITFAELAEGLLQHDVYHFGQLRILAALARELLDLRP